LIDKAKTPQGQIVIGVVGATVVFLIVKRFRKR
jgi:uncharacterized membrane protein YeaQ/YmgE (transglycosylase-associated protein family)